MFIASPLLLATGGVGAALGTLGGVALASLLPGTYSSIVSFFFFTVESHRMLELDDDRSIFLFLNLLRHEFSGKLEKFAFIIFLRARVRSASRGGLRRLLGLQHDPFDVCFELRLLGFQLGFRRTRARQRRSNDFDSISVEIRHDIAGELLCEIDNERFSYFTFFQMPVSVTRRCKSS